MNENMQEHRKYKVRCVVFGSKPEPRIEWFINGERIIDQYATVSFFSTLQKQYWYFSFLGMTDKTFQLARSIFSFHVEMFFSLGKPSNKNIET